MFCSEWTDNRIDQLNHFYFTKMSVYHRHFHELFWNRLKYSFHLLFTYQFKCLDWFYYFRKINFNSTYFVCDKKKDLFGLVLPSQNHYSSQKQPHLQLKLNKWLLTAKINARNLILFMVINICFNSVHISMYLNGESDHWKYPILIVDEHWIYERIEKNLAFLASGHNLCVYIENVFPSKI